MHQLFEEDEIDLSERQYDSCVDIVNVISDAAGANDENFFLKLFVVKIMYTPLQRFKFKTFIEQNM